MRTPLHDLPNPTKYTKVKFDTDFMTSEIFERLQDQFRDLAIQIERTRARTERANMFVSTAPTNPLYFSHTYETHIEIPLARPIRITDWNS